MVKKLSRLLIGEPRDIKDHSVFHKLSLVAFFAWVGLGADGLSSSCYGPPEAFLALQAHPYLSFFVALGTGITILVISASYSQIIDLFPTGGGGYLVASKLLSPTAGMVSGCALLVDYVLTISVSIASGADAVFSFLPAEWTAYKLPSALGVVAVLCLMNLRGVKETVLPLVPIFLVFVLTHAFVIVYAIVARGGELPQVAQAALRDVRAASGELGVLGMLILILRAYSMGAGTFTGIEAVSNGIPILREPRVQTAKKTMRYMAWSLALTAMGLMVVYVLYALRADPTGQKTLNAMLFDSATAGWTPWAAKSFTLVTLLSEGAILFVAAQAGFLDGPRVMANMALDRWLPGRFAMLSDRLVTQNGILMMGGAAFLIMLATRGDVGLLVILYSINVFITFCLSQLGMVRHWWQVRRSKGAWKWPIVINSTGLVLCLFILVTVVVLKFHEGGWVTLVITGSIVALAFWVRRHYNVVHRMLGRLDKLTQSVTAVAASAPPPAAPAFDPAGKTAVLLVGGFNGTGVHSLLNLFRFFGSTFRNFVFVQVGVIDAGNFKGAEELDKLRSHTTRELQKYVDFCSRNGQYAESRFAVGVDVLQEVDNLSAEILRKYPDAVFFGGQLVFPHDTAFSRWLHNAVVFGVQRRFYTRGIPFMILPIRVV